MKIALLLSGQPRFLRESYPFIKKYILDENDVDVYAHIWWDNSYKNKNFRFHSNYKYQDEDLGKLFLELYSPKDYIIEPQKEFDLSWYSDKKNCLYDTSQLHQNIFVPKSLFVYTSQYYSIMKANELVKKSGVNYDVVIRCRNDMVLFKDININKILPSLNLNKLYFASTERGGPNYAGHHPNTYPDWFFLGNPENMNVYCDALYNYIESCMKDGLMHVADYIPKVAILSGLEHSLFNSGTSIYRIGMEPNEFAYTKDKTYYDSFDKNNKKFNENEELPYFHKNINFDCFK